MQAGIKAGPIDPVVASITGPVPIRGLFGIGHECIAQVTAVGEGVSGIPVGDIVVVPPQPCLVRYRRRARVGLH